SSVSVLLGNGDGTFQAARNFTVGRDPTSVAVGDFNGDGLQDLAVANKYFEINYGIVSVLLGNGDGTFQPTRYDVARRPSFLDASDFNGDRVHYLLVVHSFSNSVSVLVGNGDGTFQAARNFPVGSNPTSVAVGDFNGDGRQDLAVVNRDSGNISVLLGN